MTAYWEPEFVVSSGSYMLDASPALKNFKGIPSGTMVQISSKQEGSFKSSLALAGAKEIQKIGKVGYIDAEHGVTGGQWFEALGLDLSEDKWEYYEPIDGEDCFAKAEEWIKSGEFKGIVIDSIDAAQPGSIMESEYGDAHIGNHAKLVTQAVRRFAGLCRRNQCIVWMINQMKVNFTPMGPRGHKNMGGDAINFYCKLNVEMRKGKSDSQLKEDMYIPLTVSVRRSKLGDSFVEFDTYGYQGKGIDREAELVHLALDKGIIVKRGSWYKQVCDPETGEVFDKKDEVAIGQQVELAREFCMKYKDVILK